MYAILLALVFRKEEIVAEIINPNSFPGNNERGVLRRTIDTGDERFDLRFYPAPGSGRCGTPVVSAVSSDITTINLHSSMNTILCMILAI
jgi:hypothetical protein